MPKPLREGTFLENKRKNLVKNGNFGQIVKPWTPDWLKM